MDIVFNLLMVITDVKSIPLFCPWIKLHKVINMISSCSTIDTSATRVHVVLKKFEHLFGQRGPRTCEIVYILFKKTVSAKLTMRYVIGKVQLFLTNHVYLVLTRSFGCLAQEWFFWAREG